MTIQISKRCSVCLCSRYHALFTLFVFVWCPTHVVLCFCFIFLRLVYPMLSVSLDCPFFISHSVFSNVYPSIYPSSKAHLIYRHYQMFEYLFSYKYIYKKPYFQLTLNNGQSFNQVRSESLLLHTFGYNSIAMLFIFLLSYIL